VVSKLNNVNREVKDEQDHYYDMQIRPYITLDDKIDGAVLSFVNVDDRKKLEKALRLAAIGETAVKNTRLIFFLNLDLLQYSNRRQCWIA
jgi:two-component system CheB/CheR fusion protein